MNRRIARVLSSKWVAFPLAAIPFACLSWTYQEAVDATGGLPAQPAPIASDLNSSSEEELPFSFTVTDEEFLEATPGKTLDSGENKEATAEPTTLPGANLNEILTDDTGNAAIGCFIIVLCLTPLRRLLPGSLVVSALNRHRRMIGLACFFYACLHFTLYFDDGLQRLLNEWDTVLYVQAGLASLSVLLVMAVTSNDWAVRKIGGRRWKKLHRLVYLLIPILFYHKGWAGKGGLSGGDEQVIETLIWFSPLFALQLARIFLYLRKRGLSPAAQPKGA